MTHDQQQEIQRLTNDLHRAIIKIEQMSRQFDLLRDIQRAAQYLVDVHTYQTRDTVASSGGPYGDALDNLKAALNTYYEPNGARK